MKSRQTPVAKATMQEARASYQRVSGDPEFFRAFYGRFFELCPEAKPRFEGTDFERQNRLLRHAFGLLLTYPSTSDADGPPLLSRIAERHSRRDLDVPPRLYDPFVEAMIDTLRRFDTEFTPEIEAAWRRTLAPGVQYMQERY